MVTVMAEGLVKKKRIRAGHRGVITRRVDDVKRLLREDSPDPEQITRLERCTMPQYILTVS